MDADITLREELIDVIGRCEVRDSLTADNLAIVLCTYFDGHIDKPDDDEETDNGWARWVEDSANAALGFVADAVVEHYVALHDRVADQEQRIYEEAKAKHDALLAQEALLARIAEQAAEIERLRWRCGDIRS